MAKYANVILELSAGRLDHFFTYLIPEELQGKIKEGMQVKVPFGKGQAARNGFVIELTDTCELEAGMLKPIIEIQENGAVAQQQLVALAAYIRETFGGTMSQALKTVLPVQVRTPERKKYQVSLSCTEQDYQLFHQEFQRKHAVARLRLLEALESGESVPLESITGKLGVSSKVVHALEKEGVLKVESETHHRNPMEGKVGEGKKMTLTHEQEAITRAIISEEKKGCHGVYLIHGVTGSGKTAIYLELIQEVLNQGKQAIVLIPEIALTFQTVRRFYQRFQDQVTILNSKMTQAQRSDQMRRAEAGEVSVCIGPRSALFMPFQKLGLIIIDEEHEASYKSESVPRYHAREVAIERGRLEGAGVVLGSATPSVDSYEKALAGEYRLFHLPDRYENRNMAKVWTVDLRKELKEGNRSIFSRKLRDLMEERLENKEQIMLFLNRRGTAGFVSCRSCGYVMTCPHCEVSLTAHNNGQLVCHYCGYHRDQVTRCPECGSPYIGGFKAGTQKVEELVKKQFPKARVLRMDGDSTKSRQDYENILQTFSNEEADILIGTQMIVKGHDFPKVTLVGVLAADMSLHVSDFRAAERTFQLLAQAAGRAGRGDRPGEVVIQTYSPDHYSIVAAANQDYEAFYQQEIMYRRMLQYPPLVHMLVIHVFSGKEEKADQTAERVALGIKKTGKEHVIGPADARISKIADVYHKVLYIKEKQKEELVKLRRELEPLTQEEMKQNDVTIQFDFDPMF